MNKEMPIFARPSRPLPLTPEDANEIERLAIREKYLTYRRHTRPFRRAFRGIISRRDAERFLSAAPRRQRGQSKPQRRVRDACS